MQRRLNNFVLGIFLILALIIFVCGGFNGCKTVDTSTINTPTALAAKQPAQSKCFIDGHNFFTETSPWVIISIQIRGDVFAMAHVKDETPGAKVKEALVMFQTYDLIVIRYVYYCGHVLHAYQLDLSTNSYVPEILTDEARDFIHQFLTKPTTA